jgi:hypothetical protein
MKTHKGPFYGFKEFQMGEDMRRGVHQEWLEENYPEHADKADSELPLALHNTQWATDLTIDFIKECR